LLDEAAVPTNPNVAASLDTVSSVEGAKPSPSPFPVLQLQKTKLKTNTNNHFLFMSSTPLRFYPAMKN
jgi:hypothetical protein